MAFPNPNNNSHTTHNNHDHNINLVANAVELLSSIMAPEVDEQSTTSTATEVTRMPKGRPTVEVSCVKNYACDICRKSFGSYQALGGHRASHYKFKISITNTKDYKNVDDVPQQKPKLGGADTNFRLGSSLSSDVESSSSRGEVLESFNYKIIEVVSKKILDEGITARGNDSGNAYEGYVVDDSRKRKRDSSLRICEPDQAAFDSNSHFNGSHDESNNGIYNNGLVMSVESIGVTRRMSRMGASDQEGNESRKRKRDSSLKICEPDQTAFGSNYPSKNSDESNNGTNNCLTSVEPNGVTRGKSRMGASDQEGIQENVGCSKSRTSTKSKGRENGHMDTRENSCIMSTVEKGKAKCPTSNGIVHMNLEERRAMYCTSSTTDKDVQFEEGEIEAENNEQLEEGEMEVAKNEPLEEGEIGIQEDEELEKREIEAGKYAQNKPLVLGGAKYRRNIEETRFKFAKRTKYCRTSTDQTTENSSKKYICELCKKSFGSHQALGGHRSSHNKFKISIVNTNDELSPIPKSSQSNRPSPSQGAAATATNGEDNSSSHDLYNICNRNFSSGQALGGHKRSHSDQGAGSSSSHSKPVASDEKGVETEPKVFVFDLNKIPDEKDEDEEF